MPRSGPPAGLRAGATAFLLALGLHGALGEPPAIVREPVKNAHTHELLRRWIVDPDPVRRAETVRALAVIGDPRDTELLRAALADSDPLVRAHVLQALAARDAWPQDLVLEQMARDPHPSVRHALWSTVPSGFVQRHRAQLEDALRDPVPEVRAAAALHAGTLAPSAADAIRHLQNEPEPAVREAWLRGLHRADPEVRAAALHHALHSRDAGLLCTALTLLTPEDAHFAELVRSLVSDAQGAVAAAAVEAWVRLRVPDAARPLADRLRGERNPALQSLLCDALGNVGGVDAVQGLATALRESSLRSTREAAVRALGRIPDAVALPVLIEATRDASAPIRALAAEALGHRKDPRGADALWPLFDDDAVEVIRAALNSLYRLAPPPEPARLMRLRDLANGEDAETAAAAIRVLGLLGDAESIPQLTRRIHHIRADMPPEPRAAALEAMIHLGHGAELPRAIELATRNVIPPSPMNPQPMPDSIEVRRAALRYIEHFGTSATADEIWSRLTETPPAELRADFARVLSRLTGRSYRAIPDVRYGAWDVESLDPPARPLSPEPPGIIAD